MPRRSLQSFPLDVIHPRLCGTLAITSDGRTGTVSLRVLDIPAKAASFSDAVVNELD
ncbi:MAG: hypothetical protein AB7L28_13485 [Kofleriaceae bacterium]